MKVAVLRTPASVHDMMSLLSISGLGTYVSLMSENTTRSGQGDFHAAFSSAVAILFFVTGSFLGNLFSQSRLRHSYRIMFGLITSEVATVAGFEWTGLRNVYFENRVVLLGHGA